MNFVSILNGVSHFQKGNLTLHKEVKFRKIFSTLINFFYQNDIIKMTFYRFIKINIHPMYKISTLFINLEFKF